MIGDIFKIIFACTTVAAILSAIPAWITHIVWCIMNSEFLLLLAGAIVAPVGVIHGWGIWFNWWGY